MLGDVDVANQLAFIVALVTHAEWDDETSCPKDMSLVDGTGYGQYQTLTRDVFPQKESLPQVR